MALKKSKNEAGEIVARLSAQLAISVFLGLVFLVLALVVFFAPSGCSCQVERTLHERETSTGLVLLFGGCLVVPMLAYSSRWRIVASESGIRWRSMGRWRFCKWSEVEDFYYGQHNSSTRFIVSTKAGKIVYTKEASEREALSQAIVERAANAKANEWRVEGEHDFEIFPSSYRYERNEVRRMKCAVFGFFTFLNLLFLKPWNWTRDLFIQGPRDATFLYSLAGMALFDALYGGLFLLMLWIAGAFTNDLRRRANQQLFATETGLIYQEGNDKRSISWNEIVSFQREGRDPGVKYVVIGRNDSIEFTTQITRFRSLYRLIARMAPEAEKRGREMSSCEEDFGDTSWDAIPGVRVHTYRTRSVRAVVAFFVLAPAVMSLTTLISRAMNLPAGDPTTLLVVLPIFASGLIWSALWYRRGRIIVDSDGVTKVSPWKTSKITWSQINEVKKGEGGPLGSPLRLIGEGKNLSIPLACSRARELQEEIDRRMEQKQLSEGAVL